jgi:hypothetical protein
MVQDLIQLSKHSDSGFYLHNHDELIKNLIELDRSGQNVILIGVTYALLDLIEKQQFQYRILSSWKPGGMKGKRKEMIREELHEMLCEGFECHDPFRIRNDRIAVSSLFLRKRRV